MHGLYTDSPIAIPNVCRFCGCSQERACALVAVQTSPALQQIVGGQIGDKWCVPLMPYILPPGVAVVPPDAETRIVPCQWLITDEVCGFVCSNPACVALAYAEARTLAEEIVLRLQIRGTLIEPDQLVSPVESFLGLDRTTSPARMDEATG